VKEIWNGRYNVLRERLFEKMFSVGDKRADLGFQP